MFGGGYMNHKQFSIMLSKKGQQIEEFINHDLPIIIGKNAVDLFKQNFQNESFFGNKWKDVKRRLNPRITGARATRKILTGDTANLGRSIRYKTQGSAVIIYSDLKYAAAHNEGTTNAGRGNRTTIPKRQFIGDAKEIDDMVELEINQFFNQTFK
jgi:phage gpG-like protein